MKQIRKLTMLTTMFTVFALACFAQEHPLSCGGNGTGPGGSFSFSIGQCDYLYASGSTGDLSPGVQQAYEIYSVSTEEYPGTEINASVYPNPTTDGITLAFENLPGDNCTWGMYDMNGKLIKTQTVQESISIIPLMELCAGEYLLSIFINHEQTKSFRIIKK